MNTIRILIVLAINSNCQLYQYDIENTILHMEFDEKSCSQIPPGYNKNIDRNKVGFGRFAVISRA